MGPDIPYALYEDSTGRMTLEEFLALPDAEMLLYGCPVASGEIGRDFMADLQNALGAPVAASGAPVGSAAAPG